MNNIDKIFSKLKSTEINAPDIWGKIEAELKNPSNIINGANKSTIEKNIVKSSLNKSFTFSTTLKTIGIITTTAILGVGTYLIIDNSSKEISPKTKNISKINANNSIINKSNTINKEEYKNSNIAKDINLEVKDNSKIKQEAKNIIIEYDVEDKPHEILSKGNYIVEPIHNKPANTSELVINNKVETISTEEDKISPIENDIPKFVASNLITPNGDGINDYFVIKNVDKFPENTLVIMDRKGKIVYRKSSYNNDFSAHNLPIGTYFYLFEYSHLGKRIPHKGSITVIK